MSVSIMVSPELKIRLQQKAEQAGLNIERYLSQLLEGEHTKRQKGVKGIKALEADLLQKINIGFPGDFWSKYTVLLKKRDEAKLTPAEHTELIQLSDKIEAANVERIKHLIQLAKLKGKNLDNLMSELGITPITHAY